MCRSLALSILLVPVFLHAGLTDSRYDTDIMQNMNFILQQKYDSAETLCRALIKADSGNPAGYFVLMCFLAARFYDRNDTSSLREFYAVTDRIIVMTEKDTQPIRRFYHATALGYQSLFIAKEGNWLKGAMLAFRASKIYKQMVKDGIVSGDITGMLGSFHYWTAAMLYPVLWLPFLSDTREQGIAELKEGLENSRYIKFALINSIVWVYYDTRRYHEALSLCESVLSEYPQNRVFRKIKMDILYIIGKYDESEKIAHALLKEYQGFEEVPFNFYMIRIKLGIIYYSTGKNKEGDAIAQEMSRQKFPPYLKTRLDQQLKYLEQGRQNGARQ